MVFMYKMNQCWVCVSAGPYRMHLSSRNKPLIGPSEHVSPLIRVPLSHRFILDAFVRTASNVSDYLILSLFNLK